MYDNIDYTRCHRYCNNKPNKKGNRSLPHRPNKCLIEKMDKNGNVMFHCKSELRRFPLYVGEAIFYVDVERLSYISEVFRVMFNSQNFVEGTSGNVRINDESADDIHLLLKSCCPYIQGRWPDDIRSQKLAVLLRLADKFLINSLTKSCANFLLKVNFYRKSVSVLLGLFECSLMYDICESSICEPSDHNQTIFLRRGYNSFDWFNETPCPKRLRVAICIELLKHASLHKFDSNKLKEPFNYIINNLRQARDLLRHKLSHEEVQNLSCHQCNFQPMGYRKRHDIRYVHETLRLCVDCHKEICSRCQPAFCLISVERWVQQLEDC